MSYGIRHIIGMLILFIGMPGRHYFGMSIMGGIIIGITIIMRIIETGIIVVMTVGTISILTEDVPSLNILIR